MPTSYCSTKRRRPAVSYHHSPCSPLLPFHTSFLSISGSTLITSSMTSQPGISCLTECYKLYCWLRLLDHSQAASITRSLMKMQRRSVIFLPLVCGQQWNSVIPIDYYTTVYYFMIHHIPFGGLFFSQFIFEGVFLLPVATVASFGCFVYQLFDGLKKRYFGPKEVTLLSKIRR